MLIGGDDVELQVDMTFIPVDVPRTTSILLYKPLPQQPRSWALHKTLNRMDRSRLRDSWTGDAGFNGYRSERRTDAEGVGHLKMRQVQHLHRRRIDAGEQNTVVQFLAVPGTLGL